MQAIQTKYFGPTNVRGSRIKATCQARSRIYSWDDALNPSANHTKAAETLAKQLDWKGKWVGGGLPDGTSCYCCVDGFPDETFTL